MSRDPIIIRFEPITISITPGNPFPRVRKDPGALCGFWLVFFFAAFFIAVALAAYYLLNPASTQASGPDQAKPSSFDVSTSTEDRLIPVVFGTHKVSPNLIHMGSIWHEPIIKVTEVTNGKDTEEVESVVGYATFARFLHAMADGIGGQYLTGFYFNDTLAWEGRLVDNQTAEVKTGKAAMGENSSGGSRSTIRFRSGAQTSFSEYASGLSGDIPYHGTSLVYFPDAFIGDNAGALPNYAMRIERLVDEVNPGDAAAKHKILAGTTTYKPGQNFADVILYVLREELEIFDAQVIDLTSFEVAQATLYDEDFAGFIQIDQETTAQEFIKELLRHIDAVLYLSSTTGKWTLRLIRGDYDEETLPELTDDHYRELDLDRQGWEDLPTTLEIKFLDLETWDLTSTNIENPAARFAVGARKKKSVSFQYIATEAAKKIVNARIQKRYFSPLATVRFTVPRNLRHPDTNEYWLPEPGDVLKMSHDDPEGKVSFTNLVIRVLGVGRGKNESRVTVEATQDIFAYNDIDLVDVPDAPGSGDSYILKAAPQRIFVADANPELANRSAFIVLTQAPAVGLATDFHVTIDGRYGYGGNFELAEVATLYEDFGPNVFLEDSFQVGRLGTSGVSEFSNSSGAWQRVNRPAVLVNGSDWELISVRSLVNAASNDYDYIITGIIRDLAGTGWKRDGSGWKVFPAGSQIWFLQSPGYRSVIPVNGALTVSKSVVVVARNHFDTSPSISANHTYGFTVETPYPPGLLVGSAVNGGATHTHSLSWQAHTRHGGALQGNADNNIIYDRPTEGSWEISIPADTTFEPVFVSVPSYEREVSSPSYPITYRVRSFLNGRFSEHREITLEAPA